MTTSADELVKNSRLLGDVGADSKATDAQLFEDADGRRFAVWKGPKSWIEEIDALFGALGADGAEGILHPTTGLEDSKVSAVVARSERAVERLDDEMWRNLAPQPCIEALRALARTVRAIHSAGWGLDGLKRDDLLMDIRQHRLVIGAVSGLCEYDGTAQMAWRDIRLFGELAYENFVGHQYPGGHELVTLLRDREAMVETDIATPGLAQFLAGCVTPHGDLAFRDADDLLEGLANLDAELSRPVEIRVGSRSTQGTNIYRQNNQDACGHMLVDTVMGSEQMRIGFFCVADGIGGIEDGQNASCLAVETACAAFARAWTHYDGQTLRDHPTAFARAIAKTTTQKLAIDGELDAAQNRGGTTFTGLLVAGGRAGICHVGDSRALLFRNRQIISLTRDHTLASILEELGEEASDDEDDASHRTIARFFNTGRELEYRRIDGVCQSACDTLGLSNQQQYSDGFELYPGDLFVLTTDGAHGEVAPRRLRRFLAMYRDQPQRLCEAIVDASMENAGLDNATALAVSVQ